MTRIEATVMRRPDCRCVGDKRGHLVDRYVPYSVSRVALEEYE